MTNKNYGKMCFVMTMTKGLGDYLILGDIAAKVERAFPDVICLFVHRNNPHVHLWPYDDPGARFFNVYSALQLVRLIGKLRSLKQQGYMTLGLQMAPGSLQGYFFYRALHRIRCIDHVVDFNLINADIIIPARGSYIHTIHLNQISDLINERLPEDAYRLALPVRIEERAVSSSGPRRFLVGIHPWSRRGRFRSYMWPLANWIDLLKTISQNHDVDVVVFGNDPNYDQFRRTVEQQRGGKTLSIQYRCSRSVPELIETIRDMNLLISVNTSVVHIGAALQKRMVILNGPSLDLWTPQGPGIHVVRDPNARFPGNDREMYDGLFPTVQRIPVDEVYRRFRMLMDDAGLLA